MSADLDQVFQDECDQRQRMDWHDQQAEMMNDQAYADKQILKRVLRGITTYQDYLYLVGRLQYNLIELEK